MLVVNDLTPKNQPSYDVSPKDIASIFLITQAIC